MHRIIAFCGLVLCVGCGASDDEAAPSHSLVESEAATASTESPPVLSVRADERPPAVCSDTAAILLARAVILAAPVLFMDDDIYLNDGEPLRDFVATFRGYFVQGGNGIHCASIAGPRLFAAGIGTYDPQAYDRVMSSAPPEVAHLSQSVADRINSSSVYLFELGQELTWLSRILPSVADGDMGPFFSTGYEIRNYKRQQLAAVWPLLQQMCQMGDCEAISAMLPQLRQQVDEVGLGMTYAMIMMAQ